MQATMAEAVTRCVHSSCATAAMEWCRRLRVMWTDVKLITRDRVKVMEETSGDQSSGGDGGGKVCR